MDSYTKKKEATFESFPAIHGLNMHMSTQTLNSKKYPSDELREPHILRNWQIQCLV